MIPEACCFLEIKLRRAAIKGFLKLDSKFVEQTQAAERNIKTTSVGHRQPLFIFNFFILKAI